MSELRAQRVIGEHQVAFRTANERIEATAHNVTLMGPIPFICECADLECTDIVRLTLDEYEGIRQHPRRFFNTPGHESPSVDAGAEKIVAGLREFVVVQKTGIAGDIATDANDAFTD